MDTRIIYSDNSSLNDISVNINDYYSGDETLTIVSSEDYLFIGSYFPFNHFYIKMGSTVNSESSLMTIEYWDGNDWREVAELVDETISSGKTLAQSGFITFVPHKKYGWACDDTTTIDDNEEVTGLGDITIYERYWIRISFSANLTSSIKISWLGNIFTKDDNALESMYPDLALTRTKSAYSSGKTDWEDQRVEASFEILSDLKGSNIIKNSSQILDRNDFKLANIHKTAELIYYAFGSAREVEYEKAKNRYKNTLNAFVATIDDNKNGRSDAKERNSTNSYGYR